MLYVLCDQWLRERQILAGLGVERPDVVAELFAERPTDQVAEARRARAAAAVALGGESIGTNSMTGR